MAFVNSGSGLAETRIPEGGFEVRRRKVKTPDGSVVTDCLVPKCWWDELTVDRSLARRPCSHRVLAACRHDQIVNLANLHGLLTVTIPRKPESGKVVRADSLPREPLDNR